MQAFKVGVLLVAFCAASSLLAQDYPSKPIRIITSGVGGSSDITARLIAKGISGPLRQQIIVDNRPTGVIPGQVASQAAPDGYTLLLAGGVLWTSAFLRKTPYEYPRDFAPISLVEMSVNIVTVHPSIPVKSVKELIAFAKARPGELNYSSSGVGSTSHFAMEQFKALAGVNVVHVPYKSNSAAMIDLLAGQVSTAIASASTVLPRVKDGRLRALAVTSTAPSALAPGLPTVAASGVPGYEMVSLTGMFAPAKTSDAIIRRLNEEIVRFARTPEAKEIFLKSGAEAVGNTPEEFAAAVKADMERMGKLIGQLGIKAE